MPAQRERERFKLFQGRVRVQGGFADWGARFGRECGLLTLRLTVRVFFAV